MAKAKLVPSNVREFIWKVADDAGALLVQVNFRHVHRRDRGWVALVACDALPARPPERRLQPARLRRCPDPPGSVPGDNQELRGRICAEPTRVPCASLERDRGGPRQAGRFRAAERYPSTHTKGPRLRRRQGDRLATEGRRRASARSARSRWPSPPVSAPVDSRDWLAGAGLVVPAPA